MSNQRPVSCDPRLLGLAAALLAVALAGCSHTPPEEDGLARPAIFAPLAPPFLSGSMAVLFTNANGFSARVTVQGLSDEPVPVTGALLGQGANLLFAPDPAEAPKSKEMPEKPGFTFLWNVAENRGYLLCEALQGYAPMSSRLRVSEVTLQPEPGPMVKISGHSCTREQAVVRPQEGPAAVYDVYRAPHLNGLVMRASSVGTNSPVSVELSKVRLEPLPAHLFSPPRDFTKYESAEGMVDELAARHRVYRRRGDRLEPATPMPPPTSQ